MGRGIFGGMFDFNRDGKLDSIERAAEFHFLNHLTSDSADDDDYSELEAAGLDVEELEWMDPGERRELLEDAGLDPSDFDF